MRSLEARAATSPALAFAVAELQARLFELLPNPPLATRQLDLLKADNVASGNPAGLRKLNIQPKAVEEIVPTYLGRSLGGDWLTVPVRAQHAVPIRESVTGTAQPTSEGLKVLVLRNISPPSVAESDGSASVVELGATCNRLRLSNFWKARR
jgi:hypothetical protein